MSRPRVRDADMKKSRRIRRMLKWADVLGGAPIVALPLISTPGCLLEVPVAIMDFPCQGSGEKITLQDEAGEQIDADGLLILQRRFEGRFARARCRIESHVVGIRGGKAEIPERSKLGTLWLEPNVMSYFLIPHRSIKPEDQLTMIPVIPGYYHPVEYGDILAWSEFDREVCWWIMMAHFNGRTAIRLRSSEGHEAEALQYYRGQLLPRFRADAYVRKHDLDLAFLPREGDYSEVKPLIEREIERLESALVERRQASGLAAGAPLGE